MLQLYGGDLITASMLCARAPGRDACQGDSGGPLVVSSHHQGGQAYTQAGVVSWGLGCADNRSQFYKICKIYIFFCSGTLESMLMLQRTLHSFEII